MHARTLIGRFTERVRLFAAPASPERERLKVFTPCEHEVVLLVSEGLSGGAGWGRQPSLTAL
ncbi:hypothetical protein ACFXAE_25950 [Streptomyces sp. NPDC059454]|uniref:hypothetical protein n=1 Tax=Streptomyces sp. NPDC059454 TaxID=3346836 RepID=UPI00367AC10C